jgi:NAD(P)-dependent dehydrogenase (short-subunit alcohol dehydrogenase family)
MGKLDGKVAVITGATSGMALASAKLFVEEGAQVFITGRRQDNLDNAVKAIGRNVTGVQGDSAKLPDLDRLYETVRREKGYIDVVFASAGHGGRAPLGEITEEQFDSIFSLNTRGTRFTVQKALPMIRNGGSIILNGSIAHLKGMPGLGPLRPVFRRRSPAPHFSSCVESVDLSARSRVHGWDFRDNVRRARAVTIQPLSAITLHKRRRCER